MSSVLSVITIVIISKVIISQVIISIAVVSKITPSLLGRVYGGIHDAY